MKVKGQEVPVRPVGSQLSLLPSMLALAVLVQRAGGEVTITQADIDAASYGYLIEGFKGPALCLKYMARAPQ